jgi:hypothetical protein
MNSNRRSVDRPKPEPIGRESDSDAADFEPNADGSTALSNPTSAGGGMRAGTPFSSLSLGTQVSSPPPLPLQLQRTAVAAELAAQDVALDRLSANLGRLQAVAGEISDEVAAQGVIVAEVRSVAERTAAAVEDVARRVEAVVRRNNAEQWVPRAVLILATILMFEVLYFVFF